MIAAITNIIGETLHLSTEEAQNTKDVLINALDQEHRILFWNKKAEEYFGIDKNSAIGHRLEDIIPSTRTNEKMMHLRRALAGTPVHIAKDRYERTYGYYEQWILPVKKEGIIVAALNIVRDI